MSSPRQKQDRVGPGSPAEEGVVPTTPDRTRVEGAHVLASEARARLESQGFTEEQIIDWAEAYISREGSGDVDSFMAWIAEQEASPE